MRRAKLPKAAMDALFATPPLDYEAEFDEVRAGYPNQIGREQALKYYTADRLELGVEAPKRIQTTKRLYIAFLARDDQKWRQPMNLKTFMHNWRDWEATLVPTKTATKELSREEMIRERAVSVAAFINAEGDPDTNSGARARFEMWAASFVRESHEGRWERWKDACAEVGIDPKGVANGIHERLA